MVATWRVVKCEEQAKKLDDSLLFLLSKVNTHQRPNNPQYCSKESWQSLLYSRFVWLSIGCRLTEMELTQKTFSPFLVCSEHFTHVHLKAKMVAFEDAPHIQLSLYPDILRRHWHRKAMMGKWAIRVHMQRGIYSVGIVLPVSSPGLPIAKTGGWLDR